METEETSGTKLGQDQLDSIVSRATANAKAKNLRLRKLKESNERVLAARKDYIDDDDDDDEITPEL